MQIPSVKWAALMRNFRRYERDYGKPLRPLKRVIRQLSREALAEWVFPSITEGALLLSRFEPYRDKITGPFVLIKPSESQKKPYLIEFRYGPLKATPKSFRCRLSPQNLQEISGWLDKPFMDYEVLKREAM
jgi:hypothetical protein